MQATVLRAPIIPLLLLLASCSSPPKPPTVDAANKRPANDPLAVELQVCRSELQDMRILAAESGRLADSAAATLASLTARRQGKNGGQQEPSVWQRQPNRVYTVRFGFGDARVDIPAAAAAVLIENAKAAPLVLLRGRTDGASDTPAESRIARERASAVRDYLVAAGVNPARIRATHQPAGDHVADNAHADGRALNRRVEIELYHTMPAALGASTPSRP